MKVADFLITFHLPDNTTPAMRLSTKRVLDMKVRKAMQEIIRVEGEGYGLTVEVQD